MQSIERKSWRALSLGAPQVGRANKRAGEPEPDRLAVGAPRAGHLAAAVQEVGAI